MGTRRDTTALAGYRTLLIDHRGHGRSDCPPGLPAHRMSEYVADVIAVLDDAGAGRAALVGYSAGASVAYAAARRHPARVAAVAGIGSVGAPDEDDGDVAAHAAEMFALLVEAWAGGPGSWADFPAIQAPVLIICGENEEPDARCCAFRAA